MGNELPLYLGAQIGLNNNYMETAGFGKRKHICTLRYLV